MTVLLGRSLKERQFPSLKAVSTQPADTPRAPSARAADGAPPCDPGSESEGRLEVDFFVF